MILKLYTLNSTLLNSCQWIMNSKQIRKKKKWCFKVVGVLLSYCQIDPNSLLAWFLPTPCSNFAQMWKNDFLAFLIKPFPKFKLIQWWIKKILQLEIKIQCLFNNRGPGSPQSLITPLSTQIEVYKAYRLPKLLHKTCLNFQHDPKIQVLKLLIPYYGCLIFFFSPSSPHFIFSPTSILSS